MEERARFGSARRFGTGPARRRVLLVGDHRQVAPSSGGDLASALLAAGGAPDAQGVDVDAIWDLLPALQAIAGASGSWRRWRYDLVVIVVGGRSATARLSRPLQRIVAEAAAAKPLLLALADETGRRGSDRIARERSGRVLQRLLAAGHEPAVVHTGVDEDGRLADPGGLADAVMARLDELGARGGTEPQDEEQRQLAVERSLTAIGGLTADLQRVVMLARNSFDVPYAQVNLVSRGVLHSLAFAGRTSDAMRDTLSGLVVHQDRALLVPDTHADRRFDAIPETRGPEAIRFYAGHPLVSTDGYRIGVLCVFDTEPHEIEQDDEHLLRDVAVLAEAEVNALAAAG